MDPCNSVTLYLIIDSEPIIEIPGVGDLALHFSFVYGTLQNKDKAIELHFALWPRAVDLKL